MPVIYTPTALPPASTTSTGTDGVLTAVTDPTKAGVLLRAVYAGQPPNQVTFWRTDSVTGDRVKVRSGDPALVVDGEAHAYDHEAHPGLTYEYAADDGASASASVTVTVPWLDATRDCWVKVPSAPSLSVQVKMLSPFDEDYPSRTGLTEVFGGGVVPTFDVEGPLAGTFRFRTRGKDEHDALAAALRVPAALLVQATDAHGLPREMYVARTARSVVRPGDMPGWELRDQLLSFVRVNRPATVGAPLQMPGWGWGEAVAAYGDMAAVSAAYPTMWDLLLAGVS